MQNTQTIATLQKYAIYNMPCYNLSYPNSNYMLVILFWLYPFDLDGQCAPSKPPLLSGGPGQGKKYGETAIAD